MFIMKNKVKSELQTQNLYNRISKIIEDARGRLTRAINTEMVVAYWHIGREIVEEEQKGRSRAEYGKRLLENLSKRLSEKFGKGFDNSNLWMMRQFYQTYPILDTLCRELGWSHYRALMRIDNSQARSFYEVECIKSNWSVRENEQIFASRYKLYLPTAEELINELRKEHVQNAAFKLCWIVILQSFMVLMLGGLMSR